MKPTTPRILSFWTSEPHISKEAVAAQLLLDGLRERGPLNRNRKLSRLESWQRLSAEEQIRRMDLMSFNGNPQ